MTYTMEHLCNPWPKPKDWKYQEAALDERRRLSNIRPRLSDEEYIEAEIKFKKDYYETSSATSD